MFAVVVVAMLLFTTIAVSSLFCEEELGDDNFKEFSGEDDGSGDAEPCGGGDLPGPGPPQ